MAGLLISYSKEIAKELTKIAVVLPGEPVTIGDIIYFPYGGRVMLFGKPRPRGSFKVISNLGNLNVNLGSPKKSQQKPSYIFASKGKVDVSFTGAVKGPVAGSLSTGKGALKIGFQKEGAAYFAAIECTKKELSDLSTISVALNKHKSDVLWNDTFIVTSVTTARKALIMQASQKGATIEIQGNVQPFMPRADGTPSAGAQLLISNYTNASFLLPWSKNITVFFGLHRFTKKDFGITALGGESELAFSRAFFLNRPNDEFFLEPVSALEVLDKGESEV